MKKWNAPEVTVLSINETADGLFPAMYEGLLGDCLCGNDDNHGPITGHENGKNDNNNTPENQHS